MKRLLHKQNKNVLIFQLCVNYQTRVLCIKCILLYIPENFLKIKWIAIFKNVGQDTTQHRVKNDLTEVWISFVTKVTFIGFFLYLIWRKLFPIWCKENRLKQHTSDDILHLMHFQSMKIYYDKRLIHIQWQIFHVDSEWLSPIDELESTFHRTSQMYYSNKSV